MDPIINIKNLTKSFFDILTNDYTVILNDIDFYINEGEIVSLIGPSGCGKSTLLNIISGLEDPDRGEIAITNIDVDNRLGELSYMQQKDLLLPWKTVLGNSILGLEILNKDKSLSEQKALALMDTFGLKGYENYFPNQISGGMRQRASFLRTILTDKKILLLDEPFSSLDSITRLQMQQWLLELWRKFSKTILLVTHDIDEAIFLSDRIYVMKSHLSTSINVIKVDLRRPRNREVVLEQSFLNIKKQILPMLGNEYG
jgi:ABC-type nitrate/sulfonate/bicarbonate transport system ATPase subunit